MTVTVLLHLEQADGELVWWAESDDVPGFTAAADTLVQLRRCIRVALTAELGASVKTREKLVAADAPQR